MPHPVLFTQLQSDKKDEIYVGKLDLDNYYHRLEPPKKLDVLWTAPLNLHGNLLWPRYIVVPIRSSHSVTIAMAITTQILIADAQLEPNNMIAADTRLVWAVAVFVLISTKFFSLEGGRKKSPKCMTKYFFCLGQAQVTPQTIKMLQAQYRPC